MKQIILFVVMFFSITNCFSATWSENKIITGNDSVYHNLLISNGATITVKSGATVVVSGDVTLAGSLIVEAGATVKITGTLNSDGRYVNAGLEKINSKGSIVIGGDFKTGDVSYTNNVSYKIGGSFAVGGSVNIKTNTTTVEILSEGRFSLGGDLVNWGTLTVNGRLVVGTYNSEGTEITTNGTITNNGTINIRTSNENDLNNIVNNKGTDSDAKLAAITARNLNNNSSKTINIENAFLIIHNNLTLESKSTLNFNGNGRSYVEVENSFTQNGGGNNPSKVNKSGGGKVIISTKIFDDNTMLKKGNAHPWGFDNDVFDIDDNVLLIAGKYNFNNDASYSNDRYHTNDMTFVEGEKNTINAAISEINEAIAELQALLISLDDPNSSEYKDVVDALGDGFTPEEIADAIRGEKVKVSAEISDLKSQKEDLEYQLEYVTLLHDYIAEYPNNSYNWTKKWKEFLSKRSSFLSNLIATLFNSYSPYNMIKNYIKAYGINAAQYDDYFYNISEMLPITLSYFNVSQNNENITFEWQTESEVNNDFFTVEYSVDGVNYSVIEVVQGAGNSSETLWYSTATESEQFDGMVYFRLKQTDFNGEYSYSEVKTLNVVNTAYSITMYPNPATKYVTISGEDYSNIYFVDMQNKRYVAQQIGKQTYSVEHLAKGIYFAVITTANGPVVKEFVVSKDSYCK
ncbi:MAG: T9SS type A sorting domain-containing protein [Bacteroidales bacterium]|nr:T9SS type A sorting domain-containing protein [Bacteroidales bacterium]